MGGNVSPTEQHLWDDLDALKLVAIPPAAIPEAEPEVISPEAATMMQPMRPQFGTKGTTRLSRPESPVMSEMAMVRRSPERDRPYGDGLDRPGPAFVSTSDLYQKRLLALRLGRSYQALADRAIPTGVGDAKPSHGDWQKLLAQEARAMARGQGRNRVSVMVGDSLTQAFPVDLLSQDKFWLNQSISGENSSQVLQRLAAFQTVRAESIYLMVGINDLRQGKTDAAILQNIRNSIDRLRREHPRAVIVLQAILPTRNQDLDNERIAHLNQQLGQLAQDRGAGYLDLYHLFVDETGAIREEYTTDGLHLNRLGYELWQGAIQNAETWIANHQRSA